MPNCSGCGAVFADAARFCQACGSPVEQQAPPGEERKLATVLFADLVGSTELGASQDPERTRALLQRFYDAMQAEIEAAGGTVEKFVGDAVMAAFGAPAAQEDHAERALHAALLMRRRLEELFGQSLRLRVGINTGVVVVGAAREGGSFVTGDAVNVAARLEQAAAPGEILAGARTAAAVRGAFEFDRPATVEARGIPGGVDCRRVVRALTLARPRGVSGLKRAFVGRDAELTLLEATYHRAVEQSEPHLVTLIGGAGVGKTRLVRELWGRLGHEEPEPLRRTGRCLPYGRGITYWPLAEMLREHFAILDSEPPEQALSRLGEHSALGLALGLDVAADLHPLAARERLHDAFVAFASALVASRPTVLLIEDLHWAEAPLLDVLDRLVLDLHGPLLLLATARPELVDARQGWVSVGRNSSIIRLEPLGSEASGRLLAELLGTEPPAEIAEVVGERSEGNPLFVEELLQTLIDEQVLVRGDEGWSARPLPEGFDLPDTVAAVVAARIDLLPPVEKAALQAASVIGRVFWAEPVAELLDGAEPDFKLLEERDFVRRRSGSSMAGLQEYAIKHGVIREVAYASLPKARRARLHAVFAGWIERSQAGTEELAGLLAYHFAEAVRPEDADLAWADEGAELERLEGRAVEWLLVAARGAITRYELADAVALLERALELDPPRERRLELWRALARAHALAYAGQEFWTAMQHAIAETDDAAVEAELYAELAFETAIRSGIWRRMPAREEIDGWIDRALAAAPAGSRARAKSLIARARWRPDDSNDEAIEATEIAESLADAELRSAAWDVRGICAFVAGEYDVGRAWAERRFDLLSEISDPDIRADIHAAPITGCIWNGRFGEARRLARAHDEIASRLTPHHRLHGVSIEIEVEELLGCWDEVLERQARAEWAIDENLATPCVRNPRALLVCALANVHAGDADKALRLEERAREVWMEGYGATLDTPLLRLALARDDLAKVERLLGRAEVVPGWHRGWFVFANHSARLDALAALGDRPAVEQEASLHVRPGTYLEPFALRALGVVRQDERALEQAAEHFSALRLDWHADLTRAVLAGSKLRA